MTTEAKFRCIWDQELEQAIKRKRAEEKMEKPKSPNTMPLDTSEREALWVHIKSLEAIVHRMAISKAKPINSEEWKELVRQSREVLEMKP